MFSLCFDKISKFPVFSLTQKSFGRFPCAVGTLWITSLGGYINFEYLKIPAPTVFHQRFELRTPGSESKCSSTKLSLDLYVEGGGTTHSMPKAGQMSKLKLVPWRTIRLSVGNYMYQLEATNRPYANKCSKAATIHTLGGLRYSTLGPHWSII